MIGASRSRGMPGRYDDMDCKMTRVRAARMGAVKQWKIPRDNRSCELARRGILPFQQVG